MMKIEFYSFGVEKDSIGLFKVACPLCLLKEDEKKLIEKHGVSIDEVSTLCPLQIQKNKVEDGI